TRTKVSNLASSAALDRKNFSSPVSSLLAQISQYVPADHPWPLDNHTRAALTRQTWSCSVCRASRNTRQPWDTKAVQLRTTSSAGRPLTSSGGRRPLLCAAVQEKVRGTSPTNGCLLSSRPSMKPGRLPYSSSKVSQSRDSPLALTLLTCSRAICHLG